MPNPMPADRIAEAREIIGAATPGPWTAYQCRFAAEHDRDLACGLNGESFDCSYDECHHPISAVDAAFIAAARTGWPAALDALESAQSRAELAEKALEQARRALWTLSGWASERRHNIGRANHDSFEQVFKSATEGLL